MIGLGALGWSSVWVGCIREGGPVVGWVVFSGWWVLRASVGSAEDVGLECW